MPTLRQNLISRITRLYPFYSGCGTLANSQLLSKIAGESNEIVWTNVSGGEVLAPLNDYVGKASYYIGELDRKISWICSKLVREGDTVFDIGANIGIVTLSLSRLVKHSGRVYAFEPNPVLVDLLEQVIARNNLENTKLFPLALGDVQGTLTLEIPKGNMGAASLIRTNKKQADKIVQVKVETLENIVEQEKIKSIRLIKIDVEGFEAAVFSGGKSVLEKTYPQAILFELNNYSGLFWDQSVVQLLKQYDYDFFEIPKCYLKMNLKKISCDQKKVMGHDFLAVAKGDTYQQIYRLINAS